MKFLALAGQLCIRTPLIKLWIPNIFGNFLIKNDPQYSAHIFEKYYIRGWSQQISIFHNAATFWTDLQGQNHLHNLHNAVWCCIVGFGQARMTFPIANFFKHQLLVELFGVGFFNFLYDYNPSNINWFLHWKMRKSDLQ